MAKTLTARLTLNVGLTHKNVDVGGVANRVPTDRIKHNLTRSWANGTGADQTDIPYQVQGTIAGGATTEIDLAGVLTDFAGGTLTLADIVGFVCENTSASPNTAAHIDIGPAASNGICPWLSGTGPKEEVRVGGFVARACGDATGWGGITAGTGDKLALTNKHGSQTASYKLTLWGRSS
mgnify:CR=1 FL=1